MDEKTKEQVETVNGCMLVIAEGLISTGIGGFYGWPIGVLVFGIALVIHCIRIKYKLKKMP